MADSNVKSVFKWSCLGCLGVAFFAVATLLIFGWVAGKGAEFTDAAANYPAERVIAEPLRIDDEAASADVPGTDATAVNRVRLDIDGVEEVFLRPCEEGEGLVVEATYNKKRFEYSETMEEADDGTWTYTLSMTRSGSDVAQFLERIFAGQGSRLSICLPAAAPIDLSGDLTRGGLEAKLGGLWLPAIDLDLDRAGAFIGFDEPLREPADSFSVKLNMGGMSLHEIGNASPAEIEVDYRFGGFMFDMTGDWRNDAQISLNGTASGVTVLLPRSLRVEGVPDLEPVQVANPETSPTLFFAPGTNFKDVEFQRF